MWHSSGPLLFTPAAACSPTLLTVQSYSASTSGWATEAVEDFAIDFDNNGDFAYDGVQSYAYDAWNRLKTKKI